MGQVWGWGYGGEGQLGLGSRMKMVSSPHLIPCIDQSASGKDRFSAVSQSSKFPGSYVKEIACGGRHSAVITGLHFMDSVILVLLKVFNFFTIRTRNNSWIWDEGHLFQNSKMIYASLLTNFG